MNRKRKGMTIVELVIVIGVIGIMIPTFFNLFFISLQAQSKVAILQEVKHNGDSALNSMIFLVRQNATALYSDSGLTTPLCHTAGSSGASPYFRDKNGQWFRFLVNSENKIASQSSVTSTTNFTNNRVKINQFSLSCERKKLFSPPVITIQFEVSNSGGNNRHEEQAKLFYQTKIRLRNTN